MKGLTSKLMDSVFILITPGGTDATVYMWGSENNSVELVLSYTTQVASRD